jgi:GNAT superfamily N-acetyltransferase
VIRRLGVDDWELLRDVRLAVLRDAPDAFETTYARERARSPEEWRGRISACAWFVAMVGEEPAGIAAGRRSPDGVEGRCQLISMWVSPRQRGRGLAALLIAAVRDWAVAEGARELSLEVIAGNHPATRTYAREGFVATGRREPLQTKPAVLKEEWLLTLRS